MNSALTIPATRPGRSVSQAVQRISDYRLTLGWLVTGFWLASILALDWDAQWHVEVGRDGFWTPPHWMFYSTITVCGLLCLGEVLTETLLYYRRYPGTTKTTTTPTLFFFRGPVGFILAGFGMLIMLVSAPFDDYWHRIYGVDLAIWTPFHVMLLLGIIMANLGLIYIFASEVNRRKQVMTANSSVGLLASVGRGLRGLLHPATLGLVLAAVTWLTRYWFLMAETFIGKVGPGTLEIAGYKLPSYSIALIPVPLLLVALAAFTGRFGIATLVGILFLLFRFVSAAFVNWGIQALVLDQGRTLRPGANTIALITTTYPIFVTLAGLLVDVIYLCTRRWRSQHTTKRSLLVAVVTSTLAGVVLFLLEKPWEAYNDSLLSFARSSNDIRVKFYIQANLFRPDYWQTLPVIVVLAALAGVVALAFATSLRYTER